MADNVFKPRRGSSAKIALINPILADGEICFEYPEPNQHGPGGVIKIGNGVTPYNDLPSFLDKGNFVDKSMAGAPGGYAPLNARGIVDQAFLPDDVDNIEMYSLKSQFPVPGKVNKLYVATSEMLDNLYRYDVDTDEYVKVSKPVTYTIEKDGSSVLLKGSDGSETSVSNVGGVEIRDTNPSPSELYPGKMWIIRNAT